MASSVPRAWLWSGTESIANALPPGAVCTVQTGDTVWAGNAIAEIPPFLHIVALADGLRLSHDAASAAIEALDDTTVAAGEPLGSHRMGLRTRTLRAPDAGTIRGIAESGAVSILPSEGHRTLRAERPGVVATVEANQLTITSRVVRCRLAYAIGPHDAFGRFAVAADAHTATTGADTAITAIPHISSAAELTAALRRNPGPLLIGTVSESVAWEMLAQEPGSRGGMERMIAVLLGPGALDRGTRAIARLRTFDGAMVGVNRRDCVMTIYPNDQSAMHADASSVAQGAEEAVYVDPARWYAPCIVDGAARMGLHEAGHRTLMVRTRQSGEGGDWTPVVNITKCPDSR
ncbi:MAG: hypothetical protein ACR2JW_09555 [Thermomicrobiales bacterium]